MGSVTVETNRGQPLAVGGEGGKEKSSRHVGEGEGSRGVFQADFIKIEDTVCIARKNQRLFCRMPCGHQDLVLAFEDRLYG